MRSSLVPALVALTLTVGCGASLIPGTKVEDTAANRAIYDVVESYRVALEERDMERLAPLISRRYYENASTTDSNSDDYGYDSLEKDVLPKLRDNVKKVQYRIMVRRIDIRGERASAEYEYYWKFLYSEGGREEWVAANDFNRLEMVLEDGAWRIIAGL